MIEFIEDNDLLLAIIIRKNYHTDSIEFFTDPTFSQQLGIMNRPPGYQIQPHLHKPSKRSIEYTKEVLFIRSGKLNVDFYSEQKQYLKSKTLVGGDCILLARGGHGFKMIEQTEIIEVKQGPYAGDQDKEHF